MSSVTVRSDLKQAVEGTPCLLCGQARPPVPINQTARESGVPATTVKRFLGEQNVVRSTTVDLLEKWVLLHKAML
jgi:hypothetical protein